MEEHIDLIKENLKEYQYKNKTEIYKISSFVLLSYIYSIFIF